MKSNKKIRFLLRLGNQLDKLTFRLIRSNQDDMRGYYEGKDAVILGNGPSLNNYDLSSLNDKFVIGLNKIHLIQDSNPVSIDCTIAVNDLVLKQSYKEIENSSELIFMKWKWWMLIKPKSKKINYLPPTSMVRWGYNPLRELSYGYTVTFVAMQLAYYMGFNRVYLLGVDHNFSQSGQSNSVVKMEHDDPNHFHPDYFKGQNWQLADLENSEISYAIADFIYKKNEKKIINIGIESRLNIFERNDKIKWLQKKF